MEEEEAIYENIDDFKKDSASNFTTHYDTPRNKIPYPQYNASNISKNETPYPEDPIYGNLPEPVLENPRKSPKNNGQIKVLRELEKQLQNRNIANTPYPERNTINYGQIGQRKNSVGQRANVLERPINFPRNLESQNKAHTLDLERSVSGYSENRSKYMERPSNFPKKLEHPTPNISKKISPKVSPNCSPEDNNYGNPLPNESSEKNLAKSSNKYGGVPIFNSPQFNPNSPIHSPKLKSPISPNKSQTLSPNSPNPDRLAISPNSPRRLSPLLANKSGPYSTNLRENLPKIGPKNSIGNSKNSLPTPPKVIPNLDGLNISPNNSGANVTKTKFPNNLMEDNISGNFNYSPKNIGIQHPEDTIYGNISPNNISSGNVQKSSIFAQNIGNHPTPEKEFPQVTATCSGNVRKLTESLKKSPYFERSSRFPENPFFNNSENKINTVEQVPEENIHGYVENTSRNIKKHSESLQKKPNFGRTSAFSEKQNFSKPEAQSPDDNIYGNIQTNFGNVLKSPNNYGSSVFPEKPNQKSPNFEMSLAFIEKQTFNKPGHISPNGNVGNNSENIKKLTETLQKSPNFGRVSPFLDRQTFSIPGNTISPVDQSPEDNIYGNIETNFGNVPKSPNNYGSSVLPENPNQKSPNFGKALAFPEKLNKPGNISPTGNIQKLTESLQRSPNFGRVSPFPRRPTFSKPGHTISSVDLSGNVPKSPNNYGTSSVFPQTHKYSGISTNVPKIVLPGTSPEYMEPSTSNSITPEDFGRIQVLPLNLQQSRSSNFEFRNSSLENSPEENIYGNIGENLQGINGEYGGNVLESGHDYEEEPIYGNIDNEDGNSIKNKFEASDINKNIIRKHSGYDVNDFDSDEIITDVDDFDDFDGDDDETTNDFFGVISSLPNGVDVKDIPILEMLTNSHFANLKWSQIMVQLNIDILGMSQTEIQLQDAKFELLNAERSFERSINLLYSQFVQKLFIVLSKNEQNKLFAYVKEVKDCSQSFCEQLEKCWTHNKFTEEFVNVVCEFLEQKFDVFVHYAGNQVHSESVLGEILSDKTRKTFKELLDDIHNEHCGKGLHLHAYQLLPIRKVNNFPTLVENILKCLDSHHTEYESCKKALSSSRQLISRCNKIVKEAREHMRTKAIIEKLVFPKNSSLRLNINGNVHMRHLIKSQDLILIENASTFYKKKINRTPVYALLFNDIFVLAKKCSATKYLVLDYCFRINIELDRNPVLLGVASSVNIDTILYITIKENKDIKPTVMILSCDTKTDQIRWTDAIDPPDTAKHNMQFSFNFIRKVIVQRNYCAIHTDEINLTIGEIFKILRETDDGWSFGQREYDGECGWFKSNYVVLIDDVKERVKKVKEKYQSRRQ